MPQRITNCRSNKDSHDDKVTDGDTAAEFQDNSSYEDNGVEN